VLAGWVRQATTAQTGKAFPEFGGLGPGSHLVIVLSSHIDATHPNTPVVGGDELQHVVDSDRADHQDPSDSLSQGELTTRGSRTGLSEFRATMRHGRPAGERDVATRSQLCQPQGSKSAPPTERRTSSRTGIGTQRRPAPAIRAGPLTRRTGTSAQTAAGQGCKRCQLSNRTRHGSIIARAYDNVPARCLAVIILGNHSQH
jgi:hypothetical protein